MKEFLGNSYLFGANAPFIEALYDAYLTDPQSIEPRWRGYFDELQKLDDGGAADVSHQAVQERFVALARTQRAGAAPLAGRNWQKQFAVLQLVSAYRFQGFKHADLDPLQRQEKPYIAELDPAFYGLSEADMAHEFNTGTFLGGVQAKLVDILRALRDTYCRTVGAEYMYMSDVPQKRWISERLEPARARPQYDVGY
ncbi:MAG TPA: 2-oxoglutarate dehydrogenase E1 component, partial [Burkholderiales bacterium]